jgi:hypothetical protein
MGKVSYLYTAKPSIAADVTSNNINLILEMLGTFGSPECHAALSLLAGVEPNTAAGALFLVVICSSELCIGMQRSTRVSATAQSSVKAKQLRTSRSLWPNLASLKRPIAICRIVPVQHELVWRLVCVPTTWGTPAEHAVPVGDLHGKEVPRSPCSYIRRMRSSRFTKSAGKNRRVGPH